MYTSGAFTLKLRVLGSLNFLVIAYKQVRAIDPQTKATDSLIHPREEDWSEQFRLNDEFEFEGLSHSLGRALGTSSHVQRLYTLLKG